MKKIFSFVAVAAALLVAGNANAQLSVNGGFLGNVLSTTYKYTDALGNEHKSDTSYANGLGFYAGASYNVPITSFFGIAPGLYFSYAGKSEEKTTTGTKYTDVVDMMDLNIPILFNFKWEITDFFGIMGFVGPNFRYGLNYKETYKYNDNITKDYVITPYKKADGADKPALSRFDLGVNFGAGVHFNAFRVEVGYNLGLLDIDNSKEYTTNSNHVYVGVGFAF